jgi:hypothetical protein
MQDRNKQSRNTVHIGQTRHRTKTMERQCQHWAHQTQDEDKQSRDTVNAGHTRHRTKTNNPETLSTLGTQVPGWKETIQIHCQHRKHKTQDEKKQSRETVKTGHTRYRTETSIPETLSTLCTQDSGLRQTIQRHCQHWEHKIQDEDNQSTDTVITGHSRYRMETNNPERL